MPQDELEVVFPDGKYKQLVDEVYKRLAFHPASFEVKEHHVAVYAGTDHETIVKARRPKGLPAWQHCHAFPGSSHYQWKICKFHAAVPHGAGRGEELHVLCAEFLRGAHTYKNAVFQPFIPKTHNIIIILHSG